MANKVSFTNLKMKINIPTKEISINPAITIEVAQYLPIEDKNDLISIALQNSQEEDGSYNSLKLNMYFDLYLVYMYTNFNFTEKQKEDEAKLYDILASNGILNAVKNAIPSEELAELQYYLCDLKDSRIQASDNIATAINNIINNLPKNAQAAMDTISQFDPNKFKEVLDFAKMANGNREI